LLVWRHAEEFVRHLCLMLWRSEGGDCHSVVVRERFTGLVS